MSRDAQRRAHIRPHVLIVSDDPSLSTFLGEGLTYAGFWTSVIASGLQTLEVFRLRQFDLIIIDAQLSGFDSEELIRRLRGISDRAASDTPRSHAPILVITTADAGWHAEKSSSLGVDDVLSAPLELETVAQRLHVLFDRWRETYPEAPLADEAVFTGDER